MDDQQLKHGLEHGFIDQLVVTSENCRPQLVVNNPARSEKVITTIKHEMDSCDEFLFSVAFITYDGISTLKSEFKYLEEHNIKGRIVTSQYLNFTEPRALEALLDLENIELRITDQDVSMHSKCYIFKHQDSYDFVIGSSNLTNSALCSNAEWNLKVNSKDTGSVAQELISEFNEMFDTAHPVDLRWISEYSSIFEEAKRVRQSSPGMSNSPQIFKLNKMQEDALVKLNQLHAAGASRALIVSATGSGKTYLSAFDVKEHSKKFLYIVHRNQILEKSIETYQAVLGPGRSIGLITDNRFDNLDCIFTTIQTISREDVLQRIPPNRFDYILIDEAHHAGAESYRRVIDHFHPNFLLGMTATPDRMDGFDIYEQFNHEMVCDVRLKQALECDLVCPFHYFGLTDLVIGGTEQGAEKFINVTPEERLDHIVSKAKYYGFDGKKVKGLGFCTRIRDAEEYADGFRKRGFRAEVASGKTDRRVLSDMIRRLESDGGDYLDYIFTADLFNEGVDIPAVNQVIMLRPTESPIIFIQQLGRGLRHHKDKRFLVVLDFIGNYDTNYYIPMALSDDRSYSKPETRRFVTAGDSIIPGNSTISFDEISKKKIFESIDRSNFSSLKIINAAFDNLYRMLGRIPRLSEFYEFNEMDAINLLSKFRTYYTFLSTRKGDIYHESMTQAQNNCLDFITDITASGKRIIEVEAIRILTSGTEDLLSELHQSLRMKYDLDFDESKSNIIQVLEGSIYDGRSSLVKRKGSGYTASDLLSQSLHNPCFRDHVEQVLELGEQNYRKSFVNSDNGLVLNCRYSYDDVRRILNWKGKDNGGTIGGYKFDKQSNTFPVFVNYRKGEDVAESQRYEDHFVDRTTIITKSKSTEGKDSSNMCAVRDALKNNTEIHLFVRKDKNDVGTKEFYYLGRMDFVGFMDDNRPVTLEYRLRSEVRADIYEYICSDE